MIAGGLNGFYLLAVLACPLGMLLMMWFMARGMGHRGSDRREEQVSVPELKAEQQRLAERIAALEDADDVNAEPPSAADLPVAGRSRALR